MMEFRTLGRTGLLVSRIGLGMAALGRPGYINLGHGNDLGGDLREAAMEARAHDLLDTAWRSEIRYFDVARSYGLGERFLGNWLTERGVSQEDVTVGSKWGYRYTANWKVEAEVHELKEHTFSMLKKQWGESVSLLNGYIDLYQIHSATMESGVLENNEVLEELARLRDQGTRIGLSLTGPGQSEVLRKAMEIVVDGSHLFECVQATWNLLEQSAGPALAEAHAAGIGVIIKEALANGRLTERNDDPDFAPKLTLLKRESERLRIPVDTLVMAATLSVPFADVILSGAAHAHQLLSNVRGAGTVLDDEARARLLGIVESSHEYWDKRRRLPWN
jgi:aryl-alcohol dehydrogenase-like predicted oxidoreductase